MDALSLSKCNLTVQECSALCSLCRALRAYGEPVANENVYGLLERVANILGLDKTRIDSEVKAADEDESLLQLVSVDAAQGCADPGLVLGKDGRVEWGTRSFSALCEASKAGVEFYPESVEALVPSDVSQLLHQQIFSDHERQKAHDAFMRRLLNTVTNPPANNSTYLRRFEKQILKQMAELESAMAE